MRQIFFVYIVSKEHLGGQECVSNEWNDRVVSVGTEDIVLSHCFGVCVDGSCGSVEFVDVTFNVDMSLEDSVDGSVYLAGGFLFGNPGDNEMRSIGDGVYSITVTLVANQRITYTFTNGNCEDWSWYIFNS